MKIFPLIIIFHEFNLTITNGQRERGKKNNNTARKLGMRGAVKKLIGFRKHPVYYEK